MFDLTRYQTLLAAVRSAKTTKDKGASLEDFCDYLFSSLDGVAVEYRDALSKSEEIDLVLWNAQTDEVFRALDSVVFVECKNWTKPVEAKELDAFISKLRRKELKFGFFIAANGVTGDFLNGNDGSGAVDIIKSALQSGIRVIVMTLQDLSYFTSIDEFRLLIRRRYTGLFVLKILQY